MPAFNRDPGRAASDERPIRRRNKEQGTGRNACCWPAVPCSLFLVPGWGCWWRGTLVDEVVFDGEEGGGDAASRASLAVDVLQVVADGVLGNVQGRADLRAGEAARSEP